MFQHRSPKTRSHDGSTVVVSYPLNVVMNDSDSEDACCGGDGSVVGRDDARNRRKRRQIAPDRHEVRPFMLVSNSGDAAAPRKLPVTTIYKAGFVFRRWKL